MISFLKLSERYDRTDGVSGWSVVWNSADPAGWLFRVWIFLVGCVVLGAGLGVAITVCLFIVRTFTPA